MSQITKFAHDSFFSYTVTAEGLAHAHSPGTGIKRMRIKLGIGTFAPLLLAHAHKPEKSTFRACAFTQIQIYFCLKLLICYLFNLN